MASFYLDHDVHRGTQPAQQTLGHDVVRTRELRLERVDDATQLLIAARTGHIPVTHNERDYKLLQRAWTRWPAPMAHVGIKPRVPPISMSRLRFRSKRTRLFEGLVPVERHTKS